MSIKLALEHVVLTPELNRIGKGLQTRMPASTDIQRHQELHIYKHTDRLRVIMKSICIFIGNSNLHLQHLHYCHQAEYHKRVSGLHWPANLLQVLGSGGLLSRAKRLGYSTQRLRTLNLQDSLQICY